MRASSEGERCHFYYNESTSIAFEELLATLKENGILTTTLLGGIRLVTPKDIDYEDIEKTIFVFQRMLIQMSRR